MKNGNQKDNSILSMKSNKKHSSGAVGLSHFLNVVLIHTTEVIIEKYFLTTIFLVCLEANSTILEIIFFFFFTFFSSMTSSFTFSLLCLWLWDVTVWLVSYTLESDTLYWVHVLQQSAELEAKKSCMFWRKNLDSGFTEGLALFNLGISFSA